MVAHKLYLHYNNTNYIYIITIQTISVGPTKIDLNILDIRLRHISPVDSSDQKLCENCPSLGV